MSPDLRLPEPEGSPSPVATYDAERHYARARGPIDEFGDAPECPPTIRNVGWTLGNECPYRCKHCYSMSARRKGQDMSREMIDRVVDQLVDIGVETVNLGGNEPLFTNGRKAADTLLPFIVAQLIDNGIEVGLTTSGITLRHVHQHYPETFRLLNDVDVSFDSPFRDEHNANRGAPLYDQALETLALCQDAGIPHTVIMCGMRWNFTRRHLEALLELAREYDANIRINPLKPVEPAHMETALTPEQYYDGFSYLMANCRPVDLGEPPIAAVSEYAGARRCPCGRTSFRIHSVTPAGAIHVSPCVYLHDYKSTADLLTTDLVDIIASPQFQVFRQRNANPDQVRGCAGCSLLNSCGGGCAARSYLHNAHEHGELTMLARDPYCPVEVAPQAPFPKDVTLVEDQRLVHMDYLCTWIGTPI